MVLGIGGSTRPVRLWVKTAVFQAAVPGPSPGQATMDITSANTNIGQALVWLDALEGDASNLRLSNIGPINGAALEAYDRNLEVTIRNYADKMRTALHTARKDLNGE